MLAFGFSPGPMELCIIAVIAVLLFGNRLPGIARSLGSSVVEFKKGLKGVEKVKDDIDKEARAVVKDIKEKD